MSQICAWLHVTVQSARVVRRCMAGIVAAAERDENYDGSHVAPGRGRPAKIIPGSPDAQRIEGMLLTGYGAPQATVLGTKTSLSKKKTCYSKNYRGSR